MGGPTDNETWLLDAGDAVVAKRSAGEALSAIEHLIYCVWVADYGMRNAGDLEPARDLYPNFQSHAVTLARDLGLRVTREAFAQSAGRFEADYFERFDGICAELLSV